MDAGRASFEAPVSPSFPRPALQVDHVRAERNVLAEVQHHSVVKLYYSFQDEEYLYLVGDCCGCCNRQPPLAAAAAAVAAVDRCTA